MDAETREIKCYRSWQWDQIGNMAQKSLNHGAFWTRFVLKFKKSKTGVKMIEDKNGV